jgi:hypothetical protein
MFQRSPCAPETQGVLRVAALIAASTTLRTLAAKNVAAPEISSSANTAAPLPLPSAYRLFRRPLGGVFCRTFARSPCSSTFATTLDVFRLLPRADFSSCSARCRSHLANGPPARLSRDQASSVSSFACSRSAAFAFPCVPSSKLLTKCAVFPRREINV